jgi:hypothetical protein
MHPPLIAAVLALVVSRRLSPEQQITEVVLRTYFAQTQGGTGIAFPEQRRPIRLADRTIVPSADQLEVRVFSPENRQAELDYRPVRKRLEADLLSRSRRLTRVHASMPNFALRRTRRSSCGPEPSAEQSDSVAVSRPGLSWGSQDEALLYVEYNGGARAYYLRRFHDHWIVKWHVELWACG